MRPHWEEALGHAETAEWFQSARGSAQGLHREDKLTQLVY